jgi:hypothetical protein
LGIVPGFATRGAGLIDPANDGGNSRPSGKVLSTIGRELAGIVLGWLAGACWALTATATLKRSTPKGKMCIILPQELLRNLFPQIISIPLFLFGRVTRYPPIKQERFQVPKHLPDLHPKAMCSLLSARPAKDF